MFTSSRLGIVRAAIWLWIAAISSCALMVVDESPLVSAAFAQGAKASALASGELSVGKPLGDKDNPMHIHDTALAWYTLALVLATVALAFIAFKQDAIREWSQSPELTVSLKTESPDCVSVPLHSADGTFISDAIHIGLWVKNEGKGSAERVQVFANELRKQRIDGGWSVVKAFPPCNLVWANTPSAFLDIPRGARRRIAIGNISDPARRQFLHPNVTGLEAGKAALDFWVVVKPTSHGHIVSHGEYQLDLEISAKNVAAMRCTVLIAVTGKWDANEDEMLKSGLGVSVGELTRA